MLRVCSKVCCYRYCCDANGLVSFVGNLQSVSDWINLGGNSHAPSSGDLFCKLVPSAIIAINFHSRKRNCQIILFCKW